MGSAHYGDAGVGPHPEETGGEGAAAHAVIAGPEAAADDDGEFGDGGGGDGGDELGAVFGDAAGFVFSADHKTGDVLEEDEGDPALGAELDEMGAFLGALAEENAVVGDDADGVAPEAGEAGDERGAVEAFEFVELAVVDEAGDDFADVVGFAGVGGDEGGDVGRVVTRGNGGVESEGGMFRATA